MDKCIVDKNKTLSSSDLDFLLVNNDDDTPTSSTSLTNSPSTGTVITILAEVTQQFSRQGQEQPKLAERS